MKKNLLLGTVFILSLNALSQHPEKIKPTGLFDTKTIVDAKYGHESAPRILNTNVYKPTPQIFAKEAKTSSTTWQNISSSMNIYGVLISYSKPLQWNDELNAVSFIHRKSPTYTMSPVPSQDSESGGIVAMISTDCGLNWDSTALYSNNLFWGRYPNGGIYNPPLNTDINNAFVVGAGPTTGAGATTWIGNWYASKKLGSANYNTAPSTALGAVQIMPTGAPFSAGAPSRHDFTAYNFSATDDGKMRVLAGITNDATTSDTAVMLMTGTFNNGTQAFDWEGKIFDPPTTVASDGRENWISRPMMAWNEEGTVGYVVIIGSRLGATGSNIGFQPIVYKTTDRGSTWSLENGINFNAANNNKVKNKLWTVTTNDTLVIPNFLWLEGVDCTVDFENKLHIFTTLSGHPSNDLDSLNFVSQWGAEKYLWPHAPGQFPYLCDFIYDGTNSTPNWKKLLIDSMSTEGLGESISDAGYQDNPWDANPASNNDKIRIYARLQMSRTPDGKHLLYTWSESDTAYTDFQKKWNNLPNVKARLYDVENKALNPKEYDITIDAIGEVANQAICYFVSPKFKLISKNSADISLEIPLIVSNSSPYSQLTKNQHWYSCAGLNFITNYSTQNPWDDENTIGVSENYFFNLNQARLYPNPTKNNVVLNIRSSQASDINIALVNMLGKELKTIKTEVQNGQNNINIHLQDLQAGIYFVNIKTTDGTITKKLIIE